MYDWKLMWHFSSSFSTKSLNVSMSAIIIERCTTCCSTFSKEPDRRYQWLLVDELQLIYYSIILTFTALAPTTLLSWWRTWSSKFISQKYVEDNLEESGSPNFGQMPALDKVFAEREHLSIQHEKAEARVVFNIIANKYINISCIHNIQKT